MYKLFLDDERFPADVTWVDHSNYTNVSNLDWVIVRTVKEFVETIQKNGLPSFVSFDHDLADFDTLNGTEANGLHAAKWLVDWCLDNNLHCPEFAVHSKNGPGAENINGLLMGFQHFQNQNQKNRLKL